MEKVSLMVNKTAIIHGLLLTKVIVLMRSTPDPISQIPEPLNRKFLSLGYSDRPPFQEPRPLSVLEHWFCVGNPDQ